MMQTTETYPNDEFRELAITPAIEHLEAPALVYEDSSEAGRCDALNTCYQRYVDSCRRPTGIPEFLHAEKFGSGGVRELAGNADGFVQRIQRVGYEPRPRLATRLFWLIHKAALNRVSPAAYAARDTAARTGFYTGQYRKLDKLTRATLVAPNVRLYDTLFTRLAQYERNVDSLFLQQWPAGVAPQGHFLGVCDAVTETHLIFEGQGTSNVDATLPVANRIMTWGPPEAVIKPPYLFLATIMPDRSDPRRLIVQDAYVHPVMSKRALVPVDSELQRETLVQLLDIGRWLQNTKGIDVRIVKPLFNHYIDALLVNKELPVPCRPDFIVEVSGRTRLVVDSMESNDTHYRIRKAITRSRMAKIAPVVTRDSWLFPERPLESTDGQFRRNVAARLLAHITK